MAIFVQFWGTRGSLPTPASWTRVYGGNTSCVEVRFDDSVFICDAGSGIRELGKDLMRREPRPRKLHLFITHTHWDHIQGFPFFAPAYDSDTQIRIYGNAAGHNSAHDLLSGQMSSDYFPISFRDLGAKIVPGHLANGQAEINGMRVRSFPVNHPGGCNGYVLEKDGRKIVYATDNELEIHPSDTFPDLTNDGGLRHMPETFLEIARGADLLIADAQFNDQEYEAKRGWGHSSFFSVTDLAIQAQVKNLALFHHDPENTDHDIDAKVQSCRQRAARHGARLVIFAAREGVEFKF